VKIDFCDADVLDVFDEWRRAIGIPAGRMADAEAATEEPPVGRTPSLKTHLERVLARLSNARAQGRIGPETDALLDRVSQELDAARASTRGLRGDARKAMTERLAALDAEAIAIAAEGLAADERRALDAEAEQELAAFRSRMAPDVYARARAAAVERLVRDRTGLPVIALS
jgi:hypothetical protein